jgi:bacillithiol system protein YtxJ
MNPQRPIMTDNGFTELNEIAQLDEWLRQSAAGLVIIFKHSNTCGVSARAYREMAKLSEPVGIVTVQKARPLSNEIEGRFELAHETPQVLIVCDGKLAWSASHFRITADAVSDAVKGVQPGR